MIEATALVKRFGTRTVLDGLDLRVGPGEIVALLGRNGVGKTTLLAVALASSFALLHLTGELRGYPPERPAPRRLRAREKRLLVALALAVGIVPWLVLAAHWHGRAPAAPLVRLLVGLAENPFVVDLLEWISRSLGLLFEVPRLAAAGIGLVFVALGWSSLRTALRQREERTTDLRP